MDLIKPNEEKIEEFSSTIKKIVNERQKDNKILRNRINKKLEELEDKRNRIEELAINGTFTQDRFSRKIKKVEEDITSQKIEINDIGRELLNIESMINYCKYFLNNISSLWNTGDIITKRTIQDFIFPKGAYIENGIFRTDEVAYLFRVFDKKNGNGSSLVSLTYKFSNCLLREMADINKFTEYSG